MNALVAVLLGIVEGLTEYLPVSSTGHLMLVNHAFGLKGEGVDAFTIVIQFGAILAVAVHYRALLAERARGLVARRPEAVRLFGALVVGFVPMAIVGVPARKLLKQYVFASDTNDPRPIAAALIVGGVLMIVVERVRRWRRVEGAHGLEQVSLKRAFLVGLGQCFSVWPGTSRSMATIVAGQLAGLSTETAAEFSFLLGLPTLTAATAYEALKSRHELAALGGSYLGIGLVVSFLAAWAVIAGFLRYLKKHGLEPFGYYRILIGALVLLFVMR